MIDLLFKFLCSASLWQNWDEKGTRRIRFKVIVWIRVEIGTKA